MKYLKCLLLITVAAFIFSLSPARAGNSPMGLWKTIDDKTGEAKSYLRIYEKDGKLYGKIEKLVLKPGEDPNPLCTKCRGHYKDQPILGMVIMWELKKKSDTEYGGGKIMDPDNGKIYGCKIEVLPDGKKLKVRGYIGISLAGRNQYWLKAD